MRLLKFILISFFVNMLIPMLLFVDLDRRDIENGPYTSGLLNFVIIILHFFFLAIAIAVHRLSGHRNPIKIYRFTILSNCLCNLTWLVYDNVVAFLIHRYASPVNILDKYSIGSLILLLTYCIFDFYVSANAFKEAERA